MICAAILFLHLQQEHEVRHRLTYHLRTKMKNLVLKNKGRNLTMDKILQLHPLDCAGIDMRNIRQLF
jgi:hypothetical protein